jgi:DNA (cytosine-5)-methyltransferase 1
MDPREFLELKYSESIEIVGSDDFIKSDLDQNTQEKLNEILDRSEKSKGVLAVLITSLVYKIFYPSQDIRNHQGSIENGYSGRTFDNKHITPFLKSARFPAMAESGWLTRSLEQKVPYTLDYPGAITPSSVKRPFLELIDSIQNGGNSQEMLTYLLQGLIIQRNKHSIDLAKPVNLTISKIIILLEKHFNSRYTAEGASRLPVLALYAAYQCLIHEAKRFENKKLQPIESHTSADTRSGRIGDIEIIDETGKPFEAVEVKHGIQISLQLVQDAFNKFSTTQVKRFYLLSTADISDKERILIEHEIEKIKNIHGCHVIANGLIKTLKYYLRLLNDTSDFIGYYVLLLEEDKALKFEHKQRWNEIVSS